ncbi:MAG TPA: CTP synthase [Bryobacteraceae bacterium]|jgi:CTP synthase (UTP-ammonia lyase)
MQFQVALVGDYNESVIAHQAIPEALRLAAGAGESIEFEWIHTSSIRDAAADLAGFDGIWCVPASPYASMEGALEAIRYARESRRPFLGTCGGFQHAVIEYARNVCGIRDASHAETHPNAAAVVISSLACPLVEQNQEIVLEDEGKLKSAYGAERITEGYHCSYGLNREYESLLFQKGLRPTAHSLSGEIRAVELPSHPFFVATLFQHERRALRGEIPPLVRAFIDSFSSPN